jgi:hypothetical protein
MADQQQYEHRPVRANGRDQWLISQVDPESGSRTPIGLRPASSAETLDSTLHTGTFERMTTLPIRNRALPDGPAVESYVIAEPTDRDRTLIAKVLPPVGPPIHDRSHCSACLAERGHLNVTLPPPLPPQNASAR